METKHDEGKDLEATMTTQLENKIYQISPMDFYPMVGGIYCDSTYGKGLRLGGFKGNLRTFYFI